MAFVTIPNTLVNGTTADADKVMQNFNALVSGITDGTKSINVSGVVAKGGLTAINDTHDVAFLANGTACEITYDSDSLATLSTNGNYLKANTIISGVMVCRDNVTISNDVHDFVLDADGLSFKVIYDNDTDLAALTSNGITFNADVFTSGNLYLYKNNHEASITTNVGSMDLAYDGNPAVLKIQDGGAEISGVIKLTGLSTYANNGAAIAGGLATDTLYKTAAGALMIVV